MKFLVLLMTLLIGGNTVATEEKSDVLIEARIEKIASEIIAEFDKKSPKMGTFLQNLLEEKRYELFAALAISHYNNRYIQTRYVFGSQLPKDEPIDPRLRDAVNKDVASQQRESTYEKYSSENLELIRDLAKYLQKKVDAELKKR